MVITMVDARPDPARHAEIEAAYDRATATLPSSILETFLLRDGDGLWRIATLWRSRDDLEAYRRSVAVPAAQAIFRAAGAEPEVTVLEVVRRVSA
jgi:hypothetical protein